jgi:hypothetical protein
MKNTVVLEPVADHGEVVLYDDDEHIRARLTRDDALNLIPALVDAIHKAGDISDPFIVALRLAVAGVYGARSLL